MNSQYTLFKNQCLKWKVPLACLPLFQTYEFLLKEANQSLNLISPSTLPIIYERHFLDSLQIYPLLSSYPSPFRLLDIGSGAGFPGLILSIIFSQKKSDFKINLVEKSPKKSSFLNHVIHQLKLKNTSVLTCNIYENQFDTELLLARGFAPLHKIWKLLSHNITFRQALLMKGETYLSELKKSPPFPSFFIKQIHPSFTHPHSAILEVHPFFPL